MVCKIHKNIKSSLRETIKGRDAQSTSNTVLSCALEASTHLYPPLFSFPSLPVSHFLSSFPSFYFTSSQSCFALDCRFALFQFAPIPRWIVCCPTGDVWLPAADPPPSGDALRRRGEGRTSSFLMQFWHCALPDGTNCRKENNNSTPQLKGLTHSLAPTLTLWLVNYCLGLFKYI